MLSTIFTANHFTVRVYGSVKVERWGREEKRKRRKEKRIEEKGLLCALVKGYNLSKDNRKINESEDNK